MKFLPRTHRMGRLGAVLALLCAVMLVGGVSTAAAAGGTAKPPPIPSVFIVPPHPAVPGPTFSANVADIHQFQVIGFIQDAVVDGSICPGVPPAAAGGYVTVNGLRITVPCNSVIQMPANTLSWTQAVDRASHPNLALKDGPYPSYEATIVGNTVGDRHVAGLVYLSQQSLNTGQGFVTSIDYATGRIHVGSKTGGVDQAVLEINDPNGRFGRKQSPDDRFSVDDQNPTIHGATGYPMCVPRTTSDPTAAGSADDPLCPQENRPKPVNGTCRDFVQAGVSPLPAGGNLSPPIAGAAYCTHFVMNSVAARGAADPDPRQQAPFEVGDYITWAGTLFKNPAGGPDYISAHTVSANVSIFTQPGTQPAYLALEAFGVGSADSSATAVIGARQEAQDRMFLEAETTDVVTPVDIYLIDVDPATGAATNRWVTPYAMTGENNGPLVLADPRTGFADTWIGGGITTQFTGVQSERVRLRASKAPIGLLTSPTRALRVVQRTLCLPPVSLLVAAAGYTVAQQPMEINKPNDCTKAQPAANGLFAGQYSAPTFNFIFPENVAGGDAIVPNDFWDLGFLMNGEGPGSGRLTPSPW